MLYCKDPNDIIFHFVNGTSSSLGSSYSRILLSSELRRTHSPSGENAQPRVHSAPEACNYFWTRGHHLKDIQELLEDEFLTSGEGVEAMSESDMDAGSRGGGGGTWGSIQ